MRSVHGARRNVTRPGSSAIVQRGPSQLEPTFSDGEEGVGVRLFYVLPGMSEFEASQSMGVSAGASSQSSVSWHYGHPYSQTDIPLPCPPNADSQSHTHSHSHSCSTYNLGRYIPSFDDDPKARFIDELGYTTEAEGIKSPARKRQKTGGEKGKREEEGSGEREGKTHGHVPGELGKVCADEFWERMSFRQECVAGAMTGFFTMAVTSPLSRQGGEGSGGAAEQRGQVPGQMNKRVLASLMTGHEFSSVERARWSTGKLEETIRGLCEGLGPVTPPGGVREGCVGEGVGSLEKYNSDIYGSVVVCNAGGARGVCGRVGVTVLTARKKKRRGGGEEVMR
ncbi:hypothetical protein SERLADRAFT_439288 [Serpula lacrymans var. lacrymans S7.9]|uniref:histone acetyltransferase n=1 Tax=Serpula lacrymans var. lacrymans (strain S7.9) TaxID=578457 RepID=F8NZG0_SERL9|nr:uncharacterized protein SERLADRAFT_439288 [Serpula lacrymans var. lacrymans S7.9]EGO23980.1 hypothetical protein SERLADRAFT_439288 [Serpula lacrymans var. lacrymans S7.9]